MRNSTGFESTSPGETNKSVLESKKAKLASGSVIAKQFISSPSGTARIAPTVRCCLFMLTSAGLRNSVQTDEEGSHTIDDCAACVSATIGRTAWTPATSTTERYFGLHHKSAPMEWRRLHKLEQSGYPQLRECHQIGGLGPHPLPAEPKCDQEPPPAAAAPSPAAPPAAAPPPPAVAPPAGTVTGNGVSLNPGWLTPPTALFPAVRRASSACR